MRVITNGRDLSFLEAEFSDSTDKPYINIARIETVFAVDGGVAISTGPGACPKVKGTIAEFFAVVGCNFIQDNSPVPF